MHLTTKQLFKLATLSLGLFMVVAVIAVCNLNKAAINNELAALDLVPKPEKLTELYFNNSANLPSTVTGKQEAIGFTFVIHNLETTDYQYTYAVAVDVNGTRRIVDSGDVLVKNNQYFVKNEKIKLMKLPARQNVVVELTNIRQSIDFWVGNN